MKVYNVEIIETLSRVIEQKANSYEEAVEKVSDKYDEQKIILDWIDLRNVEYKPFPPQKLNEKFHVSFTFDKEKNELIVEDNNSINNYICNDTVDLTVILKKYFEENLKLEEVIPEQINTKKDKEYER